MLFYFAGFIALATFLSKLLFCRGSVCSAARADAVFAAFSWVLWTASAVVMAMQARGEGGKGLGMGMPKFKGFGKKSGMEEKKGDDTVGAQV